MSGVVPCHYCKTPVVVSASISFDGKTCHVACAEKEKDRRALYDYLNNARGHVIDWRRVGSQRKNFSLRFGYTDKDLLAAARYQEEILQPKGARNPDHEKGIGLLPHIIEEAKEYWEKEAKEQEKIAKSFRTVEESKVVAITIDSSKPEKKKNYIDPLAFLEKEGEGDGDV